MEGSRRYANTASYLIPAAEWTSQRAEVLDLPTQAATFRDRLAAVDEEMSRYFDDLETVLAQGTEHYAPTATASFT